MNIARAAMLLLPSFLFACSAITDIQSESQSSTTDPIASIVVNPGSTVSFDDAHVSALWLPAGTTECAATDTPFTDEDHFMLTILGTSTSDKAQIASVSLVVEGNAQLGKPFSLSVNEPGQGTGQLAHAAGMNLDVEATPQGRLVATPIDQATVVVNTIPSRLGGQLSARIQMHFVNGGIFDLSLTGELQPFFKSCTG